MFAGLRLGDGSGFNLLIWLLTWQNLVDVILFHLNVWLILIQGSIVGCCVHRVRTVHVVVRLFFVLLITWDSEGAQVWRKRAKAW